MDKQTSRHIFMSSHTPSLSMGPRISAFTCAVRFDRAAERDALAKRLEARAVPFSGVMTGAQVAQVRSAIHAELAGA